MFGFKFFIYVSVAAAVFQMSSAWTIVAKNADSRCIGSDEDYRLTCMNLTLPQDGEVILQAFQNISDYFSLAILDSRINYDFEPLPFTRDDYIAEIILTNIVYYNNESIVDRLPLSNLFRNLDKSNVSELVITKCNLQHLSANDFQGFNDLSMLDLGKNNISTVDLDTLMPLRKGNHTQLTSLSLSDNNLQEFDWSTLLPIASSIMLLDLDLNKMQTLIFTTNSSNIKFPRLSRVILNDNTLSHIPQAVLETTLATESTSRTYIELSRNKFCCDCCTYESFWNWARDPRFESRISLTGACTFKNGTYASYLTTYELKLLINRIPYQTYYGSCSPTTVRPTTTRTTKTTTTPASTTPMYADLPNGCTGGMSITCASVQLPEELDITFLQSTNKTSTFSLRDSQIYHNFVPFPSNTTLKSLSLNNLVFKNNQSNIARLPFPELLVHVKSSLTNLVIQGCSIGYLLADEFGGFSRLQSLVLNNNQISVIDKNTFSEFGGTGFLSLSLSNNQLKHFDWSLLLPISATIEKINLDDNLLETLGNTSALEEMLLRNLWDLDLQGNSLQGIPTEILDTMAPGRNKTSLTITFDSDSFCCDCCPFESFVQWTYRPLVMDHLYLLGGCEYRNGTTLSLWQMPYFSVPLETFDYCHGIVRTTAVMEEVTDAAVSNTDQTVLIACTTTAAAVVLIAAVAAFIFFHRKATQKKQRMNSTNMKTMKS